ncbi:MAG: hypothetical protein H6599_11990 [Flavobacteriales bacterium]|nr:hypothetical protein [Flavobacteriales bacterium]
MNDQFAQAKKFKITLDTLQVSENEYVKNYDPKSFFGIGELQDEIDFLNVNQELMDACLFFCINKLRKKYHRQQLVFDQQLYKLGLTYTKTNSSSNFDNDGKDQIKVEKSVKYFTKQESFHAKQIHPTVHNIKLMNMKGVRGYYYNKGAVTSDESEWGLYKGNSKYKNDTTKVHEEIEPMTYLEFCDQVSKQFMQQSKQIIKNKAFSLGACSVMFDPKTLFKNKIPSVKVIFIYAGKRTALISNEDFDTSIYGD